MGQTVKPNSRDWTAIAITLLAGFTAFVTAWHAFNGNDVEQNERLARIEFVLCATGDAARSRACDQLGISK